MIKLQSLRQITKGRELKTINERIHAAASEILMEGLWPTVSNIREKLGTGSNTTINNELKIWKNEFLERFRKSLQRPSCPDVLTNAIDKIWIMACEEAELAFEERKNKLLENEVFLQENLKKLQISYESAILQKNEKEIDIENLTHEINKLKNYLENEKRSSIIRNEKIEELKKEFFFEKTKSENLVDFYKNQLNKAKEEEALKLENLKLESKQREETAYERLEGLRIYIYSQIESERNKFFEEKSNLEFLRDKLEKKNEELTKKIQSLIYEKTHLEAENNALKNQNRKKSKFILTRSKK